ncbi:hypothetical protein MRX96_029594 [Rhipicephalus microplus]
MTACEMAPLSFVESSCSENLVNANGTSGEARRRRQRKEKRKFVDFAEGHFQSLAFASCHFPSQPGPTTMTMQDTSKNLCSKLRRQSWKSEQQPKPLFRSLQTAFRESPKTGGYGTSTSNVGISGHRKEAEDIRHSHRELNNIKQGPALQQPVTGKMIVERPPSQETSYEDQVRTSENTIEKAAQRDSALFMIRQATSRTVRHKIFPTFTVVDNSFRITPCKFSRMKTVRHRKDRPLRSVKHHALHLGQERGFEGKWCRMGRGTPGVLHAMFADLPCATFPGVVNLFAHNDPHLSGLRGEPLKKVEDRGWVATASRLPWSSCTRPQAICRAGSN